MAGDGPPLQPGSVSPDGLWRWDGTLWIPTGQAMPPAPVHNPPSLKWLWWLGGGCAVLLVVAVIAGIFGLSALATRFEHGGFSCLPPDFPVYPGASVTSENSSIGTVRECRENYSSNDDVSTVADWYSSKLNSGRWQGVTDSSSGKIIFEALSGPSARGDVQLLGAGRHTQILVRVDT